MARASGREDKTADGCLALGAKILFGFLIPFCFFEKQFGDRKSDQIEQQQDEGAPGADHDHREHGPEGDEKEIEKPADPRGHQADGCEETNDAKDKGSHEHAFHEAKVRHIEQRRVAIACGFAAGRRLAAFEERDDRPCAFEDATVIVAVFKPGRHGVANDLTGHAIGQGRFESVADFDAQTPVTGDDDDENAVILTLLARFPGLEDARRVILDILSLQRGEGEEDDLVAIVGFMGFHGFAERPLRVRGENSGIIVHPSAEVGDVHICQEAGAQHQGQNGEETDSGFHRPFSTMRSLARPGWPDGVGDSRRVVESASARLFRPVSSAPLRS